MECEKAIRDRIRAQADQICDEVTKTVDRKIGEMIEAGDTPSDVAVLLGLLKVINVLVVTQARKCPEGFDGTRRNRAASALGNTFTFVAADLTGTPLEMISAVVAGLGLYMIRVPYPANCGCPECAKARAEAEAKVKDGGA